MKNRRHVVLGILAIAAVAFLVFGAHVQGQSKASPRMQLGGGFIGAGNGSIFDAVQVPLDPAGRTAALHLKFHTWNPNLAGLLTKFGADALTEATGEVEMTGQDTFKVCWIAYLVKQGNPPLVQGIMVLTGDAQFTGPDSYDIDAIFNVYPASADSDLDGFPDPGAIPIQIYSSASAKRVPIP